MKKTTYALAVAFVLLGLSWLYTTRSSTIKTQKPNSSKTDNMISYRLKYSSQIIFNPSMASTPQTITMDAKLHIKQLEHNNTSTIMGLWLTDISVSMDNKKLEELISRIYTKMVLVEKMADGRFCQYFYPGSKDMFAGLLTLYDMLQVTMHSQEHYEADELCVLGHHKALYTKTNNFLHKTRINIIPNSKIEIPNCKPCLHSKESLQRLGITDETNNNYNIKLSDFNISLSDDSKWIEDMEVEELVATTIDKMEVFEVRTLMSIHHSHDDSRHIDKQLKPNELKKTISAYKKKMLQTNNNFWKEQNREYQTQEIKEKNITIQSLMDAILTDKRFANYINLKKYLKLYPSKIKNLYQIINEQADNSVASGLIHVLELVGTQEATNVLIKLIENPQSTSLNKERVIVALGGLATPNQKVIDLLGNIITDMQTPAELTSDAILALGNLATKADMDLIPQIDEILHSYISDDTKPQLQRLAFMTAVENSPQRYKDEIYDALDSNNNEQKLIAIGALPKLDPQIAYEKIDEMLKENNSEKIIVSLVVALSSMNPTAQSIESIYQIIKKKKSPAIQKAAISYLCKTANSYPENISILKPMLKKQSDPELIKMIIRATRGW